MENESFLGHLEALRGVLLRSLTALAIAFPLGYWLGSQLIPLLTKFCLPEGQAALHYFTPMEAFIAELKLGAIIAFILIFPYVAWQFWKFVSPALYQNEKQKIIKAALFSSLLFLAGAAFAGFLLLPLLMRFAFSFQGPALRPLFGLAGFLGLAGGLLLAGGLIFQLPIVVFTLVALGIIKYETLKKGRPYAVIILLVLAAVATPPDVVSQLLLFVPAYALFELGLFLSARAKS